MFSYYENCDIGHNVLLRHLYYRGEPPNDGEFRVNGNYVNKDSCPWSEFEIWNLKNKRVNSEGDFPAYYKQNRHFCVIAWLKDGKLHREGGPAYIEYKKRQGVEFSDFKNLGDVPDEDIKEIVWYKDGKPHREEDLPAIVKKSTDKNVSIWLIDGKRHRIDNPAFISTEWQAWYNQGVLHRKDGPAVISKEGNREWWYNGLQQNVHGGPTAILSDGRKVWHKRIIDNGAHICRILHREDDRPAVITRKGTKEWWVNGKRHRENDRPAIIDSHGKQMWYKSGLLHRDVGPAVVKPNGEIQYWKNGVRENHSK